MQFLLVIAAMMATFLLVPRGFSAGEIDIQVGKRLFWRFTPCHLQRKDRKRSHMEGGTVVFGCTSGEAFLWAACSCLSF